MRRQGIWLDSNTEPQPNQGSRAGGSGPAPTWPFSAAAAAAAAASPAVTPARSPAAVSAPRQSGHFGLDAMALRMHSLQHGQQGQQGRVSIDSGRSKNEGALAPAAAGAAEEKQRPRMVPKLCPYQAPGHPLARHWLTALTVLAASCAELGRLEMA